MSTPTWISIPICILAATSCADERRGDARARPDAVGDASLDAERSAPQLLVCGLPGLSTCDPITAHPCDVAAGESCHFSVSAGGFKCIPDSPAASCEPCNVTDASCSAGLVCSLSRGCVHYCCSDADCGDTGRCIQGMIGDSSTASVGACQDCPLLPQ